MEETKIYLILFIGMIIPAILCITSVGPWEINAGIFSLLAGIGSFVMSREEIGSDKTRSISIGIFGLLLGAAFLCVFVLNLK
jgi:hypothetical protein